MAKAEAAELDLVEIAPTAKPPVCRIMDYGKFKYREAKKQHEAKLKLKQIQVKEVKFRPGTDEGDYQIKLRNLIRFLGEGDKAKITLRFRGREMAHQEFGVRLLERIRNDLEPHGVVESWPQARRPADGDGAGAEESGTEGSTASPDEARSRSQSLSAGEHRRGQQIRDEVMPKMKTKSGAKKRFRVRGSGSVKRARRSSATSSPRRPPRTSGSCAARPGSTAPTWTRSRRCCPTRKERPCLE